LRGLQGDDGPGRIVIKGRGAVIADPLNVPAMPCARAKRYNRETLERSRFKARTFKEVIE